MSRAADAAGEIRAVLPTALAARLDWDTMVLQPGSFVSPELRACFSDVLFRTSLDGRAAFVYILIQHQGGPEVQAAFRMLEYTFGPWSLPGGDNSRANTLPMIVPIVVYFSRDGRGSNAPKSSFEVTDVDFFTQAALDDLLPRMQSLVDAMAAVDPGDLPARELTPAARMMLATLKSAVSKNHLGQDLLLLLEDLLAMLSGPGAESDLRCLVTYLCFACDTESGDLESVMDGLGLRAKKAIVSTAERLYAEGVARGRAEALIELLSLKFGRVDTAIVAQVCAADSEQLREWSARVLTAGSLAEVFVG